MCGSVSAIELGPQLVCVWLRPTALATVRRGGWGFVFGLGTPPQPAGEAGKPGGHVRGQLLVVFGPGHPGERFDHGLKTRHAAGRNKAIARPTYALAGTA